MPSRSESAETTRMQHTWDVVVRLRPTLIAALFAFVVLSQPDQIFELYLINIDAWGEMPLFALARTQWVSTTIFLLLTLLLCLGSLRLLSLDPALDQRSRRHAVTADVL